MKQTQVPVGLRFGLCFGSGKKHSLVCLGGWFLGKKTLKKTGKVSHFTSLHLQNFVWGQKKSLYRDLEIWEIIQLVFFIHEMISLGSVVVAAMAVASDAAVDVADAMVEAVRQAVETTLQKLG